MNILWSFNINQAKGSPPIDIADSEDVSNRKKSNLLLLIFAVSSDCAIGAEAVQIRYQT